MTDFILIHGTTQAPTGWERLIHELKVRGHAAYAVDLPVDQPQLLPDDYASVVSAEAAAATRPIVVAHSASGLLLSAAARAVDASRQVWLAAWIPTPETTFIEELRVGTSEIFNPEWLGNDPTRDHDAAVRFLFHDCDSATLAWALQTLRLFYPAAAYASRISGVPSIPSTSIVPSQDRTFRPEWLRRAGRERLGVEPIDVPTGHCPHVSRPGLIAQILSEVAASPL